MSSTESECNLFPRIVEKPEVTWTLRQVVEEETETARTLELGVASVVSRWWMFSTETECFLFPRIVKEEEVTWTLALGVATVVASCESGPSSVTSWVARAVSDCRVFSAVTRTEEVPEVTRTLALVVATALCRMEEVPESSRTLALEAERLVAGHMFFSTDPECKHFPWIMDEPEVTWILGLRAGKTAVGDRREKESPNVAWTLKLGAERIIFEDNNNI